MIIYGSSSIGKVRKDNQDTYMFDTLEKDIGYAVVCDGMGGPGGGKIASSIAVSGISKSLSALSHECDEQKIRQTFQKAIECVNKEIYNKSLADSSLMGMGTTLVCIAVIGNICHIFNVGDSRAYIIKDGGIRRLTHDHSAVQELVDSGMLTESQARNHPNKNIITRALGVEKVVYYDYFTERVDSGDILLLCSDGITNYVDDLELSYETLRQQSVENVPQRLTELANSRGGADNSTVVIMKV